MNSLEPKKLALLRILEILNKYTDINKDNIDEILNNEIGLVFLKVLEHAGVYKNTSEGKAAFLKFTESI